MNNIRRLFEISKKTDRRIIGLMSGTSLDGLDIALCQFNGSGLSTEVKLLNFITIPYPQDFKEDIKGIFSKETISLEKLCLLNEKIGIVHANYINRALSEWNIKAEAVDAIASHGQTIFHAPFSKHQDPNYTNATLQIGDGDHIAVNTGIVTISDFRQKNIAAGGEGAPLAVYGDYILFNTPSHSTVLLNIGGIANITFLPSATSKGTMFSTDLGPGNTMLDQFMQRKYQLYFDKDALYAKKGKVNQDLLNLLLDDLFFSLPLPKSTGPELFNLKYLDSRLAKLQNGNLSNEDILATLCELSAIAISRAIKDLKEKVILIPSGGGVHNPLLMERIKFYLPETTLRNIEDYGITADSKEAVLFALLANETLSGETINFKTETVKNICMGKVSFPQ
ncbi:anhydro-N-acetylmuramic acid kinase [Pseudopedobacter beijingensis]|uniref:Anhydro-N-acetylmuramic acid kinase n=1 Tax=Pseudopedobacter beijingensis TaxID=1207056 RepID=A0ABW4IA74_9SPHI